MIKFIKSFIALFITVFLFSCSGGKTDAEHNSEGRLDRLFGKDGNNEAFQKIMDDPETATDYYKRGTFLLMEKNRDLQGAIRDFSKSIELDPAYYEAYYERGLVYTELQEYEKALADYSDAIKIKPDYISAYKNKALAYFKLKNYEKAVIEYSRIIELNPSPNGYYTSVTDPDTKKIYKGKSKQTEINEVKEAYESRAYMYVMLRNYKKAFDDYDKALEMSVSKHHIYNFRASLHMELKEPQKACDEWKKAADLGSIKAVDSLKKHCPQPGN